MTIELSNLSNAILNVFNQNGQLRLINYKPFRFYSILAGCLIAGFIHYFLRSQEDDSIILNLFGFLLVSILALSLLAWNIVVHSKWRKRVENFAKEFDKFNASTLILSDSSFELFSGNSSKIEKWNDVNSITIEPLYIFFQNKNGDQYVFPKESMSSDDFEKLAATIREKMR